MKLFKYLMLTATSLVSFSAIAQQETRFERQNLDSRDETAVREFVESKENIDVRKKANNLEISGDVRFVWQNKHEKGDVLFKRECSDSSDNSYDLISEENRWLRGNGFVGRDGIPISNNDFNVKFNLKIKYDFDKTWAMGHVQFNSLAGINSINDCEGEIPVFNEDGDKVMRKYKLNRRNGGKGSTGGAGVNLRRAFIGHNLYADGKHRLDMEIGRRQLNDIFMSEIQFDNYFDGFLLDYATQISDASDFYWKAGVFVIDQRVDHFGWATELGVLSVCGTDLDVRYSFIDWRKHGKNRCFVRDADGSRFQISQFTLAYEIVPKLFGYELPIELYGAFLINTAARKNQFSNCKKANLGWYVDLYAGNVVKKGDWTFEIIYAYVQAQAVPDYDVAGIGRGNILNERLTDVVFDGDFPSDLDPYFVRQGNANYQGCLFDFLYAITDNFSLDISYEFSVPVDRKIGGSHRFHNFELEFLYAF